VLSALRPKRVEQYREETAGVSPLQSAAYHGSREAADVLVSRTGIIPDVFYLAGAAGDLTRLAQWFGAGGHLVPQALNKRPDFSAIGWPGRGVRHDRRLGERPPGPRVSLSVMLMIDVTRDRPPDRVQRDRPAGCHRRSSARSCPVQRPPRTATTRATRRAVCGMCGRSLDEPRAYL